MKNLLFILLILPAIAFVDFNLGDISKAISNGDADALAKYFDNRVEISIMGDEDMYNKSQALQVVKTFFQNNKPKSYDQRHQGVSKGKDSHYAIGDLVTNKDSFRVYIYMKVENGKYIIQELRIDKE